jgi:hypothetical protein
MIFYSRKCLGGSGYGQTDRSCPVTDTTVSVRGDRRWFNTLLLLFADEFKTSFI